MKDLKLTQEMIDYIFNETNHFQSKGRNRDICEMRLNGASYEEIAKKYNLTAGRCNYICNKVATLYRIHLDRGDVVTVKTNCDRLKSMSIDELASFLAKHAINGGDFIKMADGYLCRNCKKRNGGLCPVPDDASCLFLEDDVTTIKRWLAGEVET